MEFCLSLLLSHNTLATMVPATALGGEDLFKDLFIRMSASKGCRLSDVQVVHENMNMLEYVRKLLIFKSLWW